MNKHTIEGVSFTLNRDDFIYEKDPHGKDPHDPGAKLDAGKTKAGVLASFSRALLEVARVGHHGAEKYSRDGWLDVPDGQERYEDAFWRHLLKMGAGEEMDPDSDLLHHAHRIWNDLASLELKLREKEGRDMPAPVEEEPTSMYSEEMDLDKWPKLYQAKPGERIHLGTDYWYEPMIDGEGNISRVIV